jgi:hypothetical protein
MVINAKHTVTVEPLDKDRFALVIDGLVRFVSYDFDACVQRAETILHSKTPTRTKDDQALQSAILCFWTRRH